MRVENKTAYRISAARLQRMSLLLFSLMKIPDSDFDLTFVTPVEIKKLNRKYRQKNKVTDVLSFPLQTGKTVRKNGVFLGDVVICVEKAYAQAKEFWKNNFEEICFLMIHGFLHLLDYDHERGVKEEAAMQRLERKLMGKIGEEFF
ncbi:MAG: rRNA maturation RNase YbeY [Deltaproteobacteria bacterium]|nr:rRNA maturation RNase YbeY [Deltaproteobacteria bacterium]